MSISTTKSVDMDDKATEMIEYLLRKDPPTSLELTTGLEEGKANNGIRDMKSASKKTKPASIPTKKTKSAMMKYNPKNPKSLLWEVEIKFENNKLAFSDKYELKGKYFKIDIPGADKEHYISIYTLGKLIKTHVLHARESDDPKTGKKYILIDIDKQLLLDSCLKP